MTKRVALGLAFLVSSVSFAGGAGEDVVILTRILEGLQKPGGQAWALTSEGAEIVARLNAGRRINTAAELEAFSRQAIEDIRSGTTELRVEIPVGQSILQRISEADAAYRGEIPTLAPVAASQSPRTRTYAPAPRRLESLRLVVEGKTQGRVLPQQYQGSDLSILSQNDSLRPGVSTLVENLALRYRDNLAKLGGGTPQLQTEASEFLTQSSGKVDEISLSPQGKHFSTSEWQQGQYPRHFIKALSGQGRNATRTEINPLHFLITDNVTYRWVGEDQLVASTLRARFRMGYVLKRQVIHFRRAGGIEFWEALPDLEVRLAGPYTSELADLAILVGDGIVLPKGANAQRLIPIRNHPAIALLDEIQGGPGLLLGDPVDLGGQIRVAQMIYRPSEGRIYGLAAENSDVLVRGNVFVLSAATGRLESQIRVPVGEITQSLALSPSGMSLGRLVHDRQPGTNDFKQLRLVVNMAWGRHPYLAEQVLSKEQLCAALGLPSWSELRNLRSVLTFAENGDARILVEVDGWKRAVFTIPLDLP